MSSTELAERAMRHTQLERSWTKTEMQDDPLYNRLANVRRDHAPLGRFFLAWTIVGGRPLIDTLFKVDRFGISGRGINMTIATVSAVREAGFLRIGHTPAKVPGLDLYLWIPYFAEVRTAPYDYQYPGKGLVCSVPLLIKYQNPIELSQIEGRLYFASKTDFAALWPEHDF